MLRTSHVTLINLLRVGRLTISQMPRGYIDFDAAELSEVTTTLLVGTALGIPIKRKAALADGKYEYDNEAGTNILTNA